MAENATLDPNAALKKNLYPDEKTDDETIKRVEAQIKAKFPDNVQTGIAQGATAKEAGIDEEEANERKKKAEEDAQEETKSNPDAVKKEAQESPPGKLDGGAAVKPNVQTPNVPVTAATDGKKGTPAGEAKQKAAGGHGGGSAIPENTKVPTPPNQITLRAASMSSDKDVDNYLNNYPTKSPETTEELSKIKEMSKIAKGFDAQVESVVPKGDESTWFKDWAGKKELAAYSDSENPYKNVQDGLGKALRGLSTVNSVVSMVGNVVGKLGFILTIVGLFAMIFPPLGSAIEAVARVLNIVGLICDTLGLIMSGAITGLNGVQLARQIGKGASNEEKAATADLMMSEANAAGGHAFNLAMHYGPKFMKGFKGASKGVIGQLFNRFKGMVGKFAAKTLGPVGNWAKNAVYKMGFGLGDGGLLKAAKAVWKSPGTLLKRVHDISLLKRFNQSSFMQGVASFGGKLTRGVDKNKFLNFWDGSLAEKMGSGLSNIGQGGSWAKTLKAGADADLQAATTMWEHTAAKNAGNKEAGRIERDIANKRSESMNKGWNGDLEGSQKPWQDADKLEAGEADAVSQAETQGLQNAKANTAKAKLEADAAKNEEAEIEEFKQDPKKFQEETTNKLAENDAKQAVLKGKEKSVKDDLKTLKSDQKAIEQKLKAPGLADEDKAALENTMQLEDAERKRLEAEREQISAERDELRTQSNDRQMVPMKAAGGEAPEHLMDAKEKVSQIIGAVTWTDENAEKQEEIKKQLEGSSGHTKGEQLEHDEHHKLLGEWQEHSFAPPSTSEHVEGLLGGLDEELGFDPNEDASASDEGGDEGGADDNGNEAANDNANDRSQDESKESKPETQPSQADSSTTAEDESCSGGELPELAYWPKLTDTGGDFDQGMADLYRMKQIAFAFQKQQVEAKKKAVEQYRHMLTADDWAKAKDAQAREHAESVKPGLDESKKSGSAANEATSQVGAGAAKQNESQGKAGKGEEAPDPGEKPSRWHPIKRIWWYVKKWASEAAAKVFSKIQEKIGSLIMRFLCGVSMDDMKAYTKALHNRMEFAAGKGQVAIESADEAAKKAQETKSKSQEWQEEAIGDAKECDQNMSDADAFVKNVEATEQDMVAEHQRATQFIESLKAAAATERARKKEEQAKKAAAALTAPGENGAASMSIASAPKAQKNMSVAPKKKEASAKKKNAVAAASITKVHTAASYVSSQTDLLVQQLVSSKQSQSIQLKEALNRAGRKSVDTAKLGDETIKGMKETATEIKMTASALASDKPADNAALQATTGKIKEQARSLDEASSQAFTNLNTLFKQAYNKAAA